VNNLNSSGSRDLEATKLSLFGNGKNMMVADEYINKVLLDDERSERVCRLGIGEYDWLLSLSHSHNLRPYLHYPNS
jgi:UDP-N-acetylenolpyruvoylglucosamine reductase